MVLLFLVNLYFLFSSGRIRVHSNHIFLHYLQLNLTLFASAPCKVSNHYTLTALKVAYVLNTYLKQCQGNNQQ